MPHIVIDFDPPAEGAPELGDSADLVYFLSWAFATRYGADHELSRAAQLLKRRFQIDTAPLLTFADRDVEEPQDAEALERAWQDKPAALAKCCREVVAALNSDEPALNAMVAEYPSLRGNIEALGQVASWAAKRHLRLRVTYELED